MKPFEYNHLSEKEKSINLINEIDVYDLFDVPDYECIHCSKEMKLIEFYLLRDVPTKLICGETYVFKCEKCGHIEKETSLKL